MSAGERIASAPDAITIGKRRLIVLDSYRRLIARQRSVGSAECKALPTPPRVDTARFSSS